MFLLACAIKVSPQKVDIGTLLGEVSVAKENIPLKERKRKLDLTILFALGTTTIGIFC